MGRFKTTPEYDAAVQDQRDAWVPACGGTEEPFRARSGARLLYCYNPGQHKHAYLNQDTDTIMTDEEARAALGV